MSDQSAARNFDGTMLKFLTHKLRTHSLNEDPNQEKADDDHDSGTESDDEFQNGNDVADELSTAMDSLDESAARDSAVPSDADLGASPPSTTTTPSSVFNFHHFNQPSSSSGCSSTETPPIIEPAYDFLLSLAQTDQHSSEEELEVINGPKVVESETATAASNSLLASGPVNITSQPLVASSSSAVQTPVLIRPNAVPEKRKWSEANSSHLSGVNGGNSSSSSSCTLIRRHEDSDGRAATTAYSAPVSRTGREASGSSDEELQGLCCSRSGSAISQPVQFRSSPPTDAHKPVRSLSPPPKLFHASAYFSSSSPSASTSCLASTSSSDASHHHHSHQHHHRTHHHHHHRPRSRPRPLSQYHSHTSLDSQQQQPCSSISQQQQQDLADIDVISSCSPRKRHRPPHRLPRPCLDFEKMQQLKAQAVTTWRHTSEHGGKELSVFCW